MNDGGPTFASSEDWIPKMLLNHGKSDQSRLEAPYVFAKRDNNRVFNHVYKIKQSYNYFGTNN